MLNRLQSPSLADLDPQKTKWKGKERQPTLRGVKQRIACKPRGLSHVSHSPNRLTDSPSLNTTTLLRRATANQPRLQARPRTFSRNSNSATSFPSISSQSTTLLGGYSGLRPPPTRKSMEEVWRGITAERVPPGSSADGHPACISRKLRGERTVLSEHTPRLRSSLSGHV